MRSMIVATKPLTHILKSQIAKYTDSVEVTIPGTFFFRMRAMKMT